MLYLMSYGHHCKGAENQGNQLFRAGLPTVAGKLVGVERFELPTSCSQSRRATRLRYTPIVLHGACANPRFQERA